MTRPGVRPTSDALQCACSSGHTDVVRWLLSLPGVRADENNNIALTNACTGPDNVHVVSALMEQPGVSFNSNRGEPFMQAVISDSSNILHWATINELADPLMHKCEGLRQLYRYDPVPTQSLVTDYLELPGVYEYLSASDEDPRELPEHDPVRAMYMNLEDIPDKRLAEKIFQQRMKNLSVAFQLLHSTYDTLWNEFGDGGIMPRGHSKQDFMLFISKMLAGS